MGEEFIYRVAFTGHPLPSDNRTDFFFHSLAAIYEQFSSAQIGCKLSRLYNIGVSDGNAYRGRLCTITREPIIRKKRTSSPTNGENLKSE